MDRCYSLFTIKSVDDDARILEGIASTPTCDRVGDCIEPGGAEFTLPLPFLWQHEKDSPIGHVTSAEVTADGIKVRVQVAKTNEPGVLKDVLDRAWQSIKLKLVRGLSIGFAPLEYEPIAGTYGVRYKKWDWLELSAVTIPANSEATISLVKSLDSEALAAIGTKGDESRSTRTKPPGATGAVQIIPINARGAKNTMNITEKIKDFENTRAAKAARRNEIQTKANEAGKSKDEAEREEFDTLSDEIKSIDKELVDLRDLEQDNIANAKPVDPKPAQKAAADSRNPARVVVTEKALPPGIRFARVVKALGVAHKTHRDVTMVAREMYPDDALVQKAAVSAGSTTGDTWGDQLVGDEGGVYADFVEFLRPQTILGKFGAGGVPSLRRVPFRVPLVGQTSGGEGYWVGEGKAKPLTKFDFTRRTMEPLKVANIAVLTDELIKSASPSAEAAVRDALAAALRERLDLDFINPDKGAVAGVSPASITNGLTAIPSSGTDADAIRADIQALFGAFIAANNAPTNGVWILPSTTALALSLMQNPLGQNEFPGIGMSGGTFAGLPAIVSEYVLSDDYGSIVVLANASDIYLADDGGVSVDSSREASLEMADNPAHNSTTPTAAQLVSMFQTNSVAFRAERTINWLRRRDDAVQFLSDVAWGS